jgi:hypothetical protein
MSRKLIVTLIVAALTCVSYGAARLGTWEDTSGDGWIDWGSGTSISPPADPNDKAAYTFLSTVGVTHGDYSLGVTQSGWGQSLSIKLQDNGFVNDFMNNTTLAIDFSVAAATTGGWVEIYTVSLNADDGSTGLWVDLDANKPAAHFDCWAGSPERTITVLWDYSQYLDDIDASPDFVEFIFAFNSGNGQDTMYVDNARLIPEPTTIALLGLGGLLLRRRKG